MNLHSRVFALSTLLTCSSLLIAPPAHADAPAPAKEDGIKIGGAVRLNYFVKSWEGQEDNRARFGDVAFDTFRLNLDGQLSKVLLSAEYRLYQGYHMLHHGYLGYAFNEKTQVQAGVNQVPFGILPYSSHNFFFGIPYYIGLEDDYDAGLKLVHASGAWNLQLAFYKSDEGSYTGSTSHSARYSYDVVPVSLDNGAESYVGVNRTDRESNQLNGRASYTFQHGDLGRTELGLSAMVGQLHNGTTGNNGSRWAGAVHLNGDYGRFNLKLQATRYEFKSAGPDTEDGNFVVMGAYDGPYKVASRGTAMAAGLAYTQPVSWGPISALTFYDNYSILLKHVDDAETSHQNVLGTMVTAGPVYAYFDFALGKNQPWLGPDYTNALAYGDPNASWETRFNVNLGYYF